jgi:DNA-binding transcriptional LysR family regulator
LAVADCSQLGEDEELDVTLLSKSQGYLVVRAGHPLLAQGKVGVEQVLAYPLVSTSRLPPRILSPLTQERANALPMKEFHFPAILCEQVSVMREIVARSDVVGMFLLSLIEGEMQAGMLVPLDCEIPWLYTQFGIVTRKNHSHSEAAQSLVRHIKRAAAAMKRKDEELSRQWHLQSRAG